MFKLPPMRLLRDGVDGWLEYFTDDVDYQAVEGAIDDRAPIHGKDALRAYMEDRVEKFDDESRAG